MQVKVKKLSDKAVLPKQTPGNAGMDLTATEVTWETTKDGVTYLSCNTDLAFEIPEGYVGLIFPRSSVTNTSLMLGNSVGVVDPSFRGSVSFRFKKVNHTSAKEYEAGDRVGQMIILPYPEIEIVESKELSDTERGSGGYGSTGA